MSPTARSLRYLRDQGWLVDVVEHRKGPNTVDLFNMFDLLAIRDGETMGVQVTSGSNVASRIRKIENNINLDEVREAEWRIEVHGWRKLKSAGNKWVVRVVDLS